MKIAICDDQKIMRDILKEQLEIYASNRKNCFVYTEYDNGLDMIKDNVVYDLIFMDYQMDRINGIDTAKELRQRKIETPIIFLTSFPDVVSASIRITRLSGYSCSRTSSANCVPNPTKANAPDPHSGHFDGTLCV